MRPCRPPSPPACPHPGPRVHPRGHGAAVHLHLQGGHRHQPAGALLRHRRGQPGAGAQQAGGSEASLLSCCALCCCASRCCAAGSRPPLLGAASQAACAPASNARQQGGPTSGRPALRRGATTRRAPSSGTSTLPTPSSRALTCCASCATRWAAQGTPHGSRQGQAPAAAAAVRCRACQAGPWLPSTAS
jgi:hypothetical protein